MTKYNKLIRDKIPNDLKKKGLKVSYHIASDSEYWEKLKLKLTEEVLEFQKSESFEEITDLLDVINAICQFKNVNKGNLEKNRKIKLINKGGFKEKIILKEVKE